MGVTNMEHIAAMTARHRPSPALWAGLLAGAVGALTSVGAELVLGVRFPLLSDTASSAFLAGLGGGLLLRPLGRDRAPADRPPLDAELGNRHRR